MKLKQEYFDDKAEQNKIALAIYEHAIDSGMYYHNIVAALTDVLNQTIREWIKDENKQRWIEK